MPVGADLGSGTAEPMRIWAWQADQSGCGYYRIAEPLRALRDYGGHRIGIQPQVRGWVEFKVMGNVAGPAELCVVQRVVSLDQTPAVRRLRKPGSKLIYEIDDDMFAIDPRNRAAFALYSKPATLEGLRTAAGLCDLVTVSTEPLATVMARETDRPVAVLPNCITDAMFDVERSRWDRVRVGWAGGQGHDSDMRSVAGQIKRFLRRNPQVDFHVIGYDYRRLLGGERVYFSTWQTPIETYWRSIDFDIGIAPLAHNVFNRSKSALKAMEYGALGIPCVASDVAPYRDVIVDGVTGFLIMHEHHWEQRLAELANDADLRASMGAAAKAHVRRFALSRNWRAWEATYARLLGKAHDRPEAAPALVYPP